MHKHDTADEVALLPTLGDVLAIPAVVVGSPEILTGEIHLSRPIRWVHICEQPNMAAFVDSDQLVLTSGMGLGARPSPWIELFDMLKRRKAVGVILELGVVVDGLPADAIAHAEELGLVIVVLTNPTRFVEITRGVHEAILDAQLDRLRLINHVHEAFTELTWNRSQTEVIVETATDLLGRPVVVEDLAHRVFHFAGAGRNLDAEMRNWSVRSPAIRSHDRITFDESERALSVQLGSQGQIWGRLVILLDDPPTDSELLIADRAAVALDLQRLIEADVLAIELHSKRSLLNKILSQNYSSTEAMSSALEAAGVRVYGRRLLGGSLRVHPLHSRQVVSNETTVQRANLRILQEALRQTDAEGLIADQSNGQISIMLSIEAGINGDSSLERFCKLVHSFSGDEGKTAKIAFGNTVEDIDAVKGSCEEANHVLSVAVDRPRLFHRVEDVRIQGLLRLLDMDPRLQSYTSRQLGPLVSQADSGELLQTLRAYLDVGRKKSAAARDLNVSRQTLYTRLERISALLETDLENPQVALSLQFALYARSSMKSARPSAY